MVREKRLNEIMRILKEKGYISIKEICERLGVSEITARRDLNFLENQGLVERKRGGASLRNFRIDIPFFFKLEENKEEKLRVARKAVSLLEDGMVIVMSGGTTVFYMAQALKNTPFHDLTIVTNSITTAWAIINLGKPFKLIHSGGMVRENSFECVGGYTLKLFEGLKADLFIFGVNGVDGKEGITFYDFEEASVAIKAMEVSSRLMVLADHSKIGMVAPYRVCKLERVDYLVVDDPSVESVKKLKEHYPDLNVV